MKNTIRQDSIDELTFSNTEQKNLENILKESEERYRQIVNFLPEAIIISVDGKIVLANKEASKYFHNLIGESIHKYLANCHKIIDKRLKQIVENKKTKTMFDYKLILDENSEIDVEICSSYLIYRGKPAVLSMIRNITERKNGLNAAAKIQKMALQNSFPFPDKAKMETLYVPAKTVSGDLFYIDKVNENLVIGIIGDVSGKGVTAALNISAFNVLFHEAVLVSHDPFDIVNNLNKKVINYCGERYIAACCFSFDFNNYEANVVGAGINQYIFKNSKNNYEERVVKGPFLGMFEDSIFDQEKINFKSGDKFYFFTDGLEFILDDEKIKEDYLRTGTITEFKNYLNNNLNDMLTDIDGIKDDCTLLALEIK